MYIKTSEQTPTYSYVAKQKVMSNDKDSTQITFNLLDVSPDELSGSSASILLYMQDGSFFQSSDVTIDRNSVIYTMKEEETKHSGNTKVQIVLTNGTVQTASLIYNFEIEKGLEKYPITEVMIQDWTTLTAEAKAFVEQIEGFTLEQFVENKMGQELANLEVNYATRLTGLEQKDNQLTAQLAQMASKESLGEVNQDLQSTKDTLNGIIVTPAEGITEQEIIDARKGKSSLGGKIEDVDTNIDEQRKQIYDHLYRFGNEYQEKTGGFADGFTAGTTTPTVTKDVDHVNVNLVYSGGVANYGLVTAEKIDLTNVNTLYIDWEQTTNNASSRIAFVASVNQNQPYNINDAIVTKFGLAKRDLTPLDVSGLTGEYNIRIHGYSNNSSGEINYKIYQIYTDLELIDRTTLEVEATKINKRFISTVYPVPAEVEGYWTPEILERQGGQSTLEVRVRLRDDSQIIHIKPENGAVDLSISWGDLKTNLSSNVKTINDKEYLFVPNNSIWVYSLITNQFLIINRTNVQPEHIIILQNQMGLVVAGEALNWFISPYKFNNDLLSDSVPVSRKEEFNDVVFNSTKKPNGSSLQFAFITDTHGEKTTYEPMMTHLNILNKMEAYGKFDFVCHGGDVIDGNLSDKDVALKNLNEAMKLMNFKTPTMTLFGNHDDNSYYKTSGSTPSDIISAQEWRNFVLKQVEDEVVFDNENPLGRYYYKDFEKQKIRVAFLDSMDYPYVIREDGTLKWAGYNGWGFQKRQLEWLRDEVLNLSNKTDWQLLVITHAGFRDEVTGAGRNKPYNSGHVEGILKAFKTGTSYEGSTSGLNEWNMAEISCDFTEQGTRDIIGVFNGHIHTDVLVKPVDLDINLISTTRSQTDRNGAFDVVTINRDDREVFLTRFGDGEDRQFTY